MTTSPARRRTAERALEDELLPQARSKSEAAYLTLRRAIVSGQITPDRPLDETALVAAFDIGRTPLREALKRLAQEQFVHWPAHSTPYIRGVGATELPQLYEARLVLEEPANRAAAERISDVELDRLDAISARIEACIAEQRVYEAVELDHALHLAIAAASGNQYLARAISQLNCGSLSLWYVAHQRVRDQTSVARHTHLLTALRGRDPQEVAAATREHVLHSYDRQLKLQSNALRGGR
jgi:DNA-binding GntR family transcriptional regulator